MELAFQQTPMECLELRLCRTVTQEQTQEFLIPDDSPDMARIVYCSSELELRSKELRANGIQISGELRTGCLYLPEDSDALQTVTTQIPFSCYLENVSLGEGLELMVKGGVRSAEAQRAHSRKLVFSIGYYVQIYGYCPAQKMICTPSDPPDCLQMKTETYTVKVPWEVTEKVFSVQEELTAAAGKGRVERIVSFALQPEITEKNLVGNKAVWKGRLHLHVLYLTPEGQLETVDFQMMLSQFCQLKDDYEQEPLQILLCMTGAQLEPVPSMDETGFLFSCNILAQYLVFREAELVHIDDAYCTRGKLSCKWNETDMNVLLDQLTKNQSLRKVEQANAQLVLAWSVYPDCPSMTQTDQTAQVQIPIRTQVLYLDRDGKLQSLTLLDQMQTEIPLSGKSRLLAELDCISDLYVSAASAGVEQRCECSVQMLAMTDQSFRTMVEASVDEAEGENHRPSVIICMNAGDSSLWDLAKKYGTTVAAIQAANASNPSEGNRILLIPLAS